MKSSILRRSIVIDGHRTSISLEDPFWNELKTIANIQKTRLSELVAQIDGSREHSNLSSAIRLFVLHYFRNLSALNRFNDETAAQSESSPPSVGECLEQQQPQPKDKV